MSYEFEAVQTSMLDVVVKEMSIIGRCRSSDEDGFDNADGGAPMIFMEEAEATTAFMCRKCCK